MRHLEAESAGHVEMIKIERTRFLEFILSILELTRSRERCFVVAFIQRTFLAARGMELFTQLSRSQNSEKTLALSALLILSGRQSGRPKIVARRSSRTVN